MKDYYKILGVTQQTPTEQIKKAYRKLAKQYHPDVVKDNKAKQERMYEIQEAFECLGNEERRKAYDESLRKASRSFMGPEKKAQGDTRSSEQVNPDMSPIKPEEMFAAFFGKMDQRGSGK